MEATASPAAGGAARLVRMVAIGCAAATAPCPRTNPARDWCKGGKTSTLLAEDAVPPDAAFPCANATGPDACQAPFTKWQVGRALLEFNRFRQAHGACPLLYVFNL